MEDAVQHDVGTLLSGAGRGVEDVVLRGSAAIDQDLGAALSRWTGPAMYFLGLLEDTSLSTLRVPCDGATKQSSEIAYREIRRWRPQYLLCRVVDRSTAMKKKSTE